MTFLYPFIIIALVPLYLMYKRGMQNIKESTLEDKKSTLRQIRFLYLTLGLILIAMSRPVIENSAVDQKFDAKDYIIAIDASYSMQADDIKPTRYEAAKEAIKELIRLHPRDRFAIFAFTSNALLISPPTTDTAISMNALNALNPEYILTKSTNLKQLFSTIAKSSHNKKNLIIFSDGGDESDLNVLASICKKNSIIPYIVASASKNGTALKKDGRYIKDQYSSLVISRINPILEDLAGKCGGKYYELESSSTLGELAEDISSQSAKSNKESVKVKSYRELFFIPLLFAILLFFATVTKLHQLYLLIPFLFLPNPSDANMLDFHHLKKADESFKEQRYLDSAKEFQKVTPSVKSYFNIATAYYKAGHYKKALEYFDMIQTSSKEIKQKIFYDMAGCAVKLKRYDRAEVYYQQALALGEDEDALFNLTLLQKLHLRTGVNIVDMLPPKDAQTKKNSSKKTGTQKDEKKEGGGKSNSNSQAGESSNGASDAKKGDTKKAEQNEEKQSQKNEYKMGYRSYEMINKGYTDEKEPW
ncbi:VWA domain-containing protein [bacterium]|nr:VWA domain-containing protein [bacterium]MBU1884845.1 VWA domain-containing protein [bacterium]